MHTEKPWDFWLLFFFFTAHLGWLWEVVLYAFLEKRFVNRGFLMGPLLPIYGLGALLFVLLFSRFRKRPFLLFFLCLLFGTVLEYLCGFFTEVFWDVRFWDYSSFSFQLHGRICLLCSLLFGLGGLLVFYALLPFFEKIFYRISSGMRFLICLVLCFFVAFDLVFTMALPDWGKGVAYAVWARLY